MPRAVATVVENNFINGLRTEANGLQFPENSCVETFDCEFDLLGNVSRRLGFDYEFGYAQQFVNRAGCAINLYQWKNVTGDGLISFQVVQIGNTLYFYSSTDGTTSLSGNLSPSTINLLPFQASGAPDPRQFECQFSDGLGKLFVVHPCLENFYVTLVAGVFVATPYTLQIRDFEGVNDGQAVDARPVALGVNDLHRYNLYNQGWTSTYVDTFHTAAGVYPSNADVWWIYKDLTDTFNPATTLANNSRGNTQAPKGHFILNLYTGDRATPAGLSGINSTSAGSARTSSTAFFAGRAWYSGIQAIGFNSKIYFTQILTNDQQVGRCYGDNDPTSETLFDLLPSAGGVINIPEAGTIYKMIPTQNNLLVFAYRGVFQISGSTGLGFSATDYVVSKLSSIRTISASSFVDINGLPMWWNTDGIWAIQPTKDGSGLTVAPVTRSTIQTFYDDIPTISKSTARGYFNPLTQVVSWLYKSEPSTTTETNYEFDRVLNLNILSGAFYPWTISPGVTVHGISVIEGTGGISVEGDVVDDADETIVDDAGDTVVFLELQNISVAPKTKFLVSIPVDSTYKFTFAEALDHSFEDWATSGLPSVYESYFITGYKLHGQANKNFQSNYVTIYHEGTGACYIQGVWDYSISTSTGRHTSAQLLSFDSEDYTNNRRRPKIRGQGKSLQYKISSFEANPFTVIGWSSWETGNTLP